MSVSLFLALCPCNCINRGYIRLSVAGFGLVFMNSTDLYLWNSTVVTLVHITYLRFNILFPVLGYDDVSETNLRSYSVHSAKHVQENRPVPIRRKRSIGKQQAICTLGAKAEGVLLVSQAGRFTGKMWHAQRKKRAISSFCLSSCTKWTIAWEAVFWMMSIGDRHAQILYIHFLVAACWKARPRLENAVIFNV